MIGKKLIGCLLAKGFIVRCGIHKNNTIRGIEQNMELMQCDILNQESIVSFVRGQDIVIHAAGLIPTHKKHKKSEYYEINVNGTANVINACIKSGIKKLIFFSSQAAQESAKGNYGKSKYEAENKIKISNMDWVILKVGQVVYKNGFITKLATAIKNGARFVPIPSGVPKNLELLDIDALAECVASIASDKTEKFNHKIIHLGCEERIDVGQIVGKLCELLNKKPLKIGLPLWFLRISVVITHITSDSLEGMYAVLPPISKENTIRMANMPWENILRKLLTDF